MCCKYVMMRWLVCYMMYSYIEMVVNIQSKVVLDA